MRRKDVRFRAYGDLQGIVVFETPSPKSLNPWELRITEGNHGMELEPTRSRHGLSTSSHPESQSSLVTMSCK